MAILKALLLLRKYCSVKTKVDFLFKLDQNNLFKQLGISSFKQRDNFQNFFLFQNLINLPRVILNKAPTVLTPGIALRGLEVILRNRRLCTPPLSLNWFQVLFQRIFPKLQLPEGQAQPDREDLKWERKHPPVYSIFAKNIKFLVT